MKMTYIPAQYRVRVEFTRRDTLVHLDPPAFLMQKARQRLQQEVKAGHLAFYRFFETRLTQVWHRFRTADVPEDQPIGVTLATGAPPTTGILVKKAPTLPQPALGKLTITMKTERFRQLRVELFKLIVGHQLRKLGIFAPPHVGQITALWYRARRSEAITDYVLFAMPPATHEQGEAYQVVLSDYGVGIELRVFDLKATLAAGVGALMDEIRDRARQWAHERGLRFRILAGQVERELHSASRGPEMYGIDLPLIILCAVTREIHEAKPAPKPEPLKVRRALVDIDVSEDGLEAVISRVHPSIYDQKAWQDPGHWRRFMAQKHIVFGLEEQIEEQLAQAVKNHEDIEHRIIAQGKPSKPGEDPYFVETFRDREAREGEDFRDAQNRMVVKEGEVIGEFRFRQPAELGTNVYGESLLAEVGEFLFMELGEGVRQEPGGRIVATQEGVPEFEDQVLKVVQRLVVPGDVNMASGNIQFSGHCQVMGDIDKGSRVHVEGDLVVEGAILEADVWVGGHLTVKGGIVGGAQDKIVCIEGLRCSYIENAHLLVRGDAVVEKGVIQSHLTVQGHLTIERSDGVIAGGVIQAWRGIDGFHVGRSSQVKTQLIIGNNPKVRRMALTRGKRFKMLETKTQTMRSEKPSFAGGKPPLEWLRLYERLKRMLEKAEELYQDAKSRESIYRSALLQARGVVYPGVELAICGHSYGKGVTEVRDVIFKLTPANRVVMRSAEEKAS